MEVIKLSKYFRCDKCGYKALSEGITECPMCGEVDKISIWVVIHVILITGMFIGILMSGGSYTYGDTELFFVCFSFWIFYSFVHFVYSIIKDILRVDKVQNAPKSTVFGTHNYASSLPVPTTNMKQVINSSNVSNNRNTGSGAVSCLVVIVILLILMYVFRETIAMFIGIMIFVGILSAIKK